MRKNRRSSLTSRKRERERQKKSSRSFFFIFSSVLNLLLSSSLIMHTVIRRSPSMVSASTVADLSTVNVRIDEISPSDLNVQDVVTTSSSSDDDSNKTKQSQSRILPSVRISHQRSTPTNKSIGYDNQWDLGTTTKHSPTERRKPPISPRIKSSSSTTNFSFRSVPTVFTTTCERLGHQSLSVVQSDVRPQTRRSQSNPSSPTIPIVFLTDDILLGSIRALQNERQLCKLSVDYLIDATNMRPDELARKANIGARLPCQCGHTHSRCILTVEFDSPFLPSTSMIEQNNLSASKIRELTRLQLEQLFTAVNRFIFKAQQEQKRILIYGFELTANSPLAVIAIQYLMINNEQLSLADATHRIHRLFPILPIEQQQYPIMEKRFQDYLKQLDRKTFPRNFLVHSISTEGSSSTSGGTIDLRKSSRELSWDSPETTTTNTAANTSQRTSLTSWTTSPMPFDRQQILYPARTAWDI